MHLEVIAAKNEVIYNLQRHVASLEEQLKNPAPVNVKVEMPTVQIPAPTFSRRGLRKTPSDEPPQEPINWETIDETDLEQLAVAARRELGGATVSPYILSQTITRIKSNIRQAKLAKARKLFQEGRIAANRSPEAPRPEAAVVEEESERIPAHILNMVETAERG